MELPIYIKSFGESRIEMNRRDYDALRERKIKSAENTASVAVFIAAAVGTIAALAIKEAK